MNVKKRLELFIRGWLPKEPNVPRNKLKMAETQAKVSKTKPWWWKLLWIITLLATIVSGAAGYFLLGIPLERAAGGVALTFICIGFAYYIRVRPSLTVNRALYILLGITPLGFSLMMLYVVSGIGSFIAAHLGPVPNLIGFIVPYVVGAFIGDWIGKRRNYILPLSP